MSKHRKPESEPLGGRQNDAQGKPVTAGGKYDRDLMPAAINNAQVPQEPLGDQDRGRRA